MGVLPKIGEKYYVRNKVQGRRRNIVAIETSKITQIIGAVFRKKVLQIHVYLLLLNHTLFTFLA